MIRLYSFLTHQRAVRIEPAALFVWLYAQCEYPRGFMTGKMRSGIMSSTIKPLLSCIFSDLAYNTCLTIK